MKRAIWRQVRTPALVAILYLVALGLFAWLTRDGGLVSPAGVPDGGLLVLGVLTLGLRLVVLFVLPALLTYRAVMRLLGGRRQQDPPSAPGADRPA